MTASQGHARPTGARSTRYHLDSRIATGGMGEVWRATDTVLGREVAVKVLKAEYADDPTFRSRFASEARHAAALHHPNVASVFDVGELPDDGSGSTRPFLVMELVPGQPLSALLQSGEPMPPGNAADLVAQAADAISAAHAMDVVHRDVKPANLLVTPQGQVKITDFGIARAADAVALTLTGQIVGTPHYISPEQAEGRTATKASDIYSLGVVLYECLAGRRPFAGGTPVTIALAHLRDPVPALPSNIPGHLRAVVDRALAKDPAERFGSAAEMASALRGGLDTATRVMELPQAPAAARDPRRALPPWWPWVAAAAAVLLVIVLVTLAAADAQEKAVDDNPVESGSVQPGDDRVRVSRASYLGVDRTQAREDLEALGFEVDERKRPAASPDQRKDSVAAVTPYGLVEPGSTITLTVFEGYQAPKESDAGSMDGEGDDEGDDQPDTGKKGPSDKESKPGNAKGDKQQ